MPFGDFRLHETLELVLLFRRRVREPDVLDLDIQDVDHPCVPICGHPRVDPHGAEDGLGLSMRCHRDRRPAGQAVTLESIELRLVHEDLRRRVNLARPATVVLGGQRPTGQQQDHRDYAENERHPMSPSIVEFGAGPAHYPLGGV